MMTAGYWLEDVKIEVFSETHTQESVPQSNKSKKKAVWILFTFLGNECHSTSWKWHDLFWLSGTEEWKRLSEPLFN